MKSKTRKSPTSFLEEHFNPDESFTIGNYWYGIILHLGFRFDTYCVKRIFLPEYDCSPDAGVWLDSPEKRFETFAGARLAILMDLERLNLSEEKDVGECVCLIP